VTARDRLHVCSVADASGNNLTGTFVGSNGWANSNALSGSNSAVVLTTNSYINVPDNSAFNTMQNNFTIEAWINLDGTKTDNTIVDRANYNFLFQAQAYGGGMGFYNPNGGWSFSNVAIPNNQWIHVACTWNAATGTLLFYKNGVLINTFNRPSMYFNAGPMNIGRQEPNGCQCNKFPGKMDELRLWNVTRTAAEIAANYANTVSAVGGSSSTFAWSPATGLNTTTGISVIASPTASTNYIVTETNTLGCSTSSAPISVTILSSASTTNIITCNSSYTWNGNTYTTSGTYTKTGLTNSKGCDSTATLNLTIKPNYTITASASSNGSISNSGTAIICSGDNSASYIIAANAGYLIADVLVDGVSQGAISTYTFNNVTANHTITASFVLACQPTTSTTNLSICSNLLPYTWNGLVFNAAGSRTKNLISSSGCDSAATLNLTVTEMFTPSVSISTIKDTVCSGSNVTFTAIAANGGTSPLFQWQKNGNNVGVNNAVYVD
ncbi:MAG: LamG domain-containing protein, partial [Chitinophagaceae bacterium]